MTSNALTGTRDHCRRMATALHTDDCFALVPARWGGTTTKRPNPDCTGCVPESDRALFAQLAGEIDAYLSGDLELVAPTSDDVPLDGITWGDVQDAARTALAPHYLGGHDSGLPCDRSGDPTHVQGRECRFSGTGVPQVDDSEAVQS